MECPPPCTYSSQGPPAQLKLTSPWTCLVVQWLRILLPIQGTQVWSGAPGRLHTPQAVAPQLLSPCALEPVLGNKRQVTAMSTPKADKKFKIKTKKPDIAFLYFFFSCSDYLYSAVKPFLDAFSLLQNLIMHYLHIVCELNTHDFNKFQAGDYSHSSPSALAWCQA